MMNNKGSAVAWLLFLALMFCFILIYNVFSPALSSAELMAESLVNETVGGGSTMGIQANETFDVLGIVWKYWPLMLLAGLLLWAMLSSMRYEPVYEGV